MFLLCRIFLCFWYFCQKRQRLFMWTDRIKLPIFFKGEWSIKSYRSESRIGPALAATELLCPVARSHCLQPGPAWLGDRARTPRPGSFCPASAHRQPARTTAVSLMMSLSLAMAQLTAVGVCPLCYSHVTSLLLLLLLRHLISFSSSLSSVQCATLR